MPRQIIIIVFCFLCTHCHQVLHQLECDRAWNRYRLSSHSVSSSSSCSSPRIFFICCCFFLSTTTTMTTSRSCCVVHDGTPMCYIRRMWSACLSCSATLLLLLILFLLLLSRGSETSEYSIRPVPMGCSLFLTTYSATSSSAINVLDRTHEVTPPGSLLTHSISRSPPGDADDAESGAKPNGVTIKFVHDFRSNEARDRSVASGLIRCGDRSIKPAGTSPFYLIPIEVLLNGSERFSDDIYCNRKFTAPRILINV